MYFYPVKLAMCCPGNLSLRQPLTSSLQEEMECGSGVVKKLLTAEEWIVGHCSDGSVLVWDRLLSTPPNVLDVSSFSLLALNESILRWFGLHLTNFPLPQVSAVDISLLYNGHYVFILQSDSAVLWSLSERHFVDNISLDRYVTGSDNKLRSGDDVAFVLDGSNVVPLAVLNH